jgi:capsular polysaccharide biosynthesis protein
VEFRDYIRIIRRRGWIIVLLSLLTAAAAFGFSKMQTPVYEASARLLITSRPDFGQTQAVRELQRNFAAYLLSTYRAQDVIDELQLDMTPGQLMANVSIAPSTSESVIQVNFEHTDRQIAEQVARTWADQLRIWREDQNTNLREEDRINAELLDEPTSRVASPQTVINTGAGAVLGALMGLIVVFVLEWIESGIVRRAEDVERYLDIPVIGNIPQQSS